MGNRCSIFSRGMEFTRAHCHARRGTQKMGVPRWRILVLRLLRSFLCVLENVYLSSFHYTPTFCLHFVNYLQGVKQCESTRNFTFLSLIVLFAAFPMGALQVK